MKKTTPSFYHKGTRYAHMGGEAWRDVWAEGNAALFHRQNGHERFAKYRDQMLNGRTDVIVFFPFCGKAVEMKQVYDLGHQVVGVDLASQPLEEFFEEHELEVITTDLKNNGKLYKSRDGRIRLYCMDLYDFGPDLEKNMEAVWDRGSLEAVNLEERNKYVKTILRVLGGEFRYLVVCFEYDPTEYTGPPHTFSTSDMETLFVDEGKSLSVTLLESVEQSQEKKKEFGASYLRQCLYKITPKPSRTYTGSASPTVL